MQSVCDDCGPADVAAGRHDVVCRQPGRGSAQRGVLGGMEIERVNLGREWAVAFGLGLHVQPFRVRAERRPGPLGVVSIRERQQVDEEVFVSVFLGSLFEERNELKTESGEDAKGVNAKARP